MNKDLMTNITIPVSLLAPASVTADGNGTGIDLQPYDGPCMVVLDCAAGTGDSLTTNGAMAEDSGWTKGTGWTVHSVTAGKADCDGTQTAVSDLSQNQTVTEGTKYTVTYTVSSRTAGTVWVILAGTAGTVRSANGTFVEVITAGAGTDPKLVIRGDADFIGKIDDVAVCAASMAVHLEESSDNSSFTDISGAAFDTVYGIASLQKKVIHVDERKRYLRAVKDITGASAAFVMSVHALPFPVGR